MPTCYGPMPNGIATHRPREIDRVCAFAVRSALQFAHLLWKAIVPGGAAGLQTRWRVLATLGLVRLQLLSAKLQILVNP